MMESRKIGVTAADLAEELSANLRTVYRDLNVLHESGFPIYQEKKGKNSYWKLLDTFRKNFPLPLTATELMSLHMSRDMAKIFQGTVFHESMESLFDKVRSALPPDSLRYLDNMSGTLQLGFPAWKNLTACKEAIRIAGNATAEGRRVEIVYKAVSTKSETVRKVDPYHVWLMNGGFYLIGLCHLRNSVRTFALDRIKEIRQLEEPFHFPQDFDLTDYLRDAFHVMRGEPERVVIRFSAEVAHIVRERTWHDSQDIREYSDGGVELFLEVPINFEIISWILGFGSTAVVISPESLRERIKTELYSAAGNYEPPFSEK